MTTQKIKEEIIIKFSEIYQDKSYLDELNRGLIYGSFIHDSLTRIEEAVREEEKEKIREWAEKEVAIIPRINPETFEMVGEANQHYIDKQKLFEILSPDKNEE